MFPVHFTPKRPPGTRGGAADPAHQCRFAALYPGYDKGLDCFQISSSVSDLRHRHCGSAAALLRGTDSVGSALRHVLQVDPDIEGRVTWDTNGLGRRKFNQDQGVAMLQRWKKRSATGVFGKSAIGVPS